jgi:hypothetical protein
VKVSYLLIVLIFLDDLYNEDDLDEEIIVVEELEENDEEQNDEKQNDVRNISNSQIAVNGKNEISEEIFEEKKGSNDLNQRSIFQSLGF